MINNNLNILRIEQFKKDKLLVFGYSYQWKMLPWYHFILQIVDMYYIIPNIQRVVNNHISYCINGLIIQGKIPFLIFHHILLELAELSCIQIVKEFFWFKKSIQLLPTISIPFQGDKLMLMNKSAMQLFVKSEKRLALKQNL